VLNTKFTIL